MTITEAGASDLVFYYDFASLRSLAESDIFNMMVQPPSSMFYNRQYGAGLQMREGLPNSATIQVQLRSDVVSAFANRNRQVSAGANGYPDRRAYVSQSTVTIEQDPQSGEVDIQIGYILAADMSAMRTTRVPGGK